MLNGKLRLSVIFRDVSEYHSFIMLLANVPKVGYGNARFFLHNANAGIRETLKCELGSTDIIINASALVTYASV